MKTKITLLLFISIFVSVDSFSQCPLPPADITISNNTACSITMDATVDSSFTYQWRRLGVDIPGATQSSYTSTISGDVDCIITNSCGSTSSWVVGVNVLDYPFPPPILGGMSAGVCGTGRTYVVTNPQGGGTYDWIPPAGATMTNPHGTIADVTFGSSFGSGNITVIYTNSCGYASEPAYYFVIGAPGLPENITGPVSVCHNANNVVYSIPFMDGSTSYTWTAPPGATIKKGQGTNQIKIHFGTSGGNVTVRGNNDCGQGLVQTLAISMPCRVADISVEDFDVTLYPNPTIDDISITNLGSEVIDQIEIYSSLGTKVYARQSETGSQESTIIRMASLPSGIYFITAINQEGNRVTRRVVKM